MAMVLAVGGGLVGATASAPANAATVPVVVAFDWWHGTREASSYFASVRPSVLGGRNGEPIQSLSWSSWNLQGAKGTGLLFHMSCQPCHATVVLSHAKLRPSGHGHFFNWETVTFREFSNVTRLRWSFAARDWIRAEPKTEARQSCGCGLVLCPKREATCWKSTGCSVDRRGTVVERFMNAASRRITRVSQRRGSGLLAPENCPPAPGGARISPLDVMSVSDLSEVLSHTA
jgi:hypothetical protein